MLSFKNLYFIYDIFLKMLMNYFLNKSVPFKQVHFIFAPETLLLYRGCVNIQVQPVAHHRHQQSEVHSSVACSWKGGRLMSLSLLLPYFGICPNFYFWRLPFSSRFCIVLGWNPPYFLLVAFLLKQLVFIYGVSNECREWGKPEKEMLIR